MFFKSILVLKVKILGLWSENHQNLLLTDQIFAQILVFQVDSCLIGQHFGLIK